MPRATKATKTAAKTTAKATKATKTASAAKETSKVTSKTTATKRATAKKAAPLDKFLEGQKKALEEERATYLHQAESLKAEADLLMADREPGDVQFDEESGEGDTLAVERERDLALSAQARAAIEEIDKALEKIIDGTYGVCEVCGEAIPKERLRALPYAALCVRCKSGGLGTRR
jgi:DnaK suppressor protein